MEKLGEKIDIVIDNQNKIMESQKRLEVHNSFITRLYFIFRYPLAKISNMVTGKSVIEDIHSLDSIA